MSIYVTSKINTTMTNRDYAELQQMALDALLNQATFDEALVDRAEHSYVRTITHMKEGVERSTEVRNNHARLEARIGLEIANYRNQGGNPEQDYTRFLIPKASGGFREINAPTDELKYTHQNVLHHLYNMQVLTHNNAFAYVPKRSIVDALKVHQANESQWFLKIDLTDFFPSCTREMLKNNISQVYPFCFMNEATVDAIIDISMLNGGLPQGSPLSPLLSNLAMVPFDYQLNKKIYHMNNQHFVYTRYADDIIISSKHQFSFTDMVEVVDGVLREYAAPHRIKPEKTHYGSRSGRNWNLGLMLNKDNNITIGYRKKRRVKAMLHQFMMDFAPPSVSDTPATLTLDDYYHIIGQVEYAKQIEPDYWQDIIRKMELKLRVTYRECRRQALTV